MKFLRRWIENLGEMIVRKLEDLEDWEKSFTVTIKSPIYLKKTEEANDKQA